MRILVIVSGEYGRRHAENIRQYGPSNWAIEVWQGPAALPPMLDYPEEYLPEALPPADLLLVLGERPAIAELIPEIARRTGARAVIAPVDREEWLPRGLARQLRGWLAEQGVACVTPKPFCSLTETHYNVRGQRTAYTDPLITAFAHRFGQPALRLEIDPSGKICSVTVVRDAACGCARFVSRGLVGISADEAEYTAGMLHHHYPCLAGMTQDLDLSDTLMHVSGNILKEQIAEQVRPYRRITYIVPGKRSE